MIYNNQAPNANVANQWKSNFIRCAQAGIQNFEYEQQQAVSRVLQLNDLIASATSSESIQKFKTEKFELSKTLAELDVLIKYGYEERNVLMQTDDYYLCMDKVEEIQKRMNDEFCRISFMNFNRPRA